LLGISFALGLSSCRNDSKDHRVTLRWQPSPSTSEATVVGYNIYRRTNAGSPYEIIATHVPGPPYEDSKVTAGTTYVYAVTVVDQHGRESAFSNLVTVEVP
jgi:fibronectin type 3 domain-containing protein